MRATTQNIPKFSFPEEFILSPNPQHFSKAEETLLFLKEVTIPCVKSQQQLLKFPADQKALVIMDNFTGQMTVVTTDAFKEVRIWIVSVPANMTKYYQPLDLAVHVYTKTFFKYKFNEWHSDEVLN